MSIQWRVSKDDLLLPFSSDIDKLLSEDPDQWVVTYGRRSTVEQATLYDRYLAGGPLAAPPGHSAHEEGLAVDVTLVREGRDIWDYRDPSWRRLVGKIHMHPRLHSLDDHGDTDHIEAVNWRILAVAAKALHAKLNA